MTEAWVQSLFDEEPEAYGPKPAYDPAERRQRPVQQTTNHGGNKESRQDFGEKFYNAGNPLGAPPLDWWNVSEEEVRRRIILAMCPEKVCRVCGEPSRRIVGDVAYVHPETGEPAPERQSRFMSRPESDRTAIQQTGGDVPKRLIPTGHAMSLTAVRPTIGFSDCGHDDWRPGVVLDPFA